MVIRKAGGVVLALIGLWVLAGPVSWFFERWTQAHPAHVDPKMVGSIASQLTIGGMMLVVGAYLLTGGKRDL